MVSASMSLSFFSVSLPLATVLSLDNSSSSDFLSSFSLGLRFFQLFEDIIVIIFQFHFHLPNLFDQLLHPLFTLLLSGLEVSVKLHLHGLNVDLQMQFGIFCGL